MKRICACLLIVFASGVTHLAHATDSKKSLTVGMELSYPPFEMIDKNGAPVGVSVELAHALGKFLPSNGTIAATCTENSITANRMMKEVFQ